MSRQESLYEPENSQWDSLKRYDQLIQPWSKYWDKPDVFQVELEQQICYWYKIRILGCRRPPHFSAWIIKSQTKRREGWGNFQLWWFLRKIKQDPIQVWEISIRQGRGYCTPDRPTKSNWENQIIRQPPRLCQFHNEECYRCKNWQNFGRSQHCVCVTYPPTITLLWDFSQEKWVCQTQIRCQLNSNPSNV